MKPESFSVVGTIISIVLFIIMGPSFAYRGYKKWKQTDRTEESQSKSGKFEFFLGIILFVLAIILVIVLIFLVKNNIITDLPISTNPDDILDDPDSPVLPEGKDGVYVSNQIYHDSTYSGYVNESRQPNGIGTMEYSDGTKYIGNWVDGVREGTGKMKYNNGIYDGEWQNDKKNGKGEYVWNDGKKYEGEYTDDMRSGKGTFSGWVDLTNGYSGTYYGESNNDQFNGYGEFLFDNGDKFEGIYKENFFWTGTYTQKDGSQYKIIDGKPQS